PRSTGAAGPRGRGGAAAPAHRTRRKAHHHRPARATADRPRFCDGCGCVRFIRLSGWQTQASGEAQASAGGGEEAGAVTAPVAGSLVDYLVDDGAEVEVGDEVAVVSAMKMGTRVEAPASGTFRQLAAVGAAVAVGEAIARVE